MFCLITHKQSRHTSKADTQAKQNTSKAEHKQSRHTSKADTQCLHIALVSMVPRKQEGIL